MRHQRRRFRRCRIRRNVADGLDHHRGGSNDGHDHHRRSAGRARYLPSEDVALQISSPGDDVPVFAPISVEAVTQATATAPATASAQSRPELEYLGSSGRSRRAATTTRSTSATSSSAKLCPRLQFAVANANSSPGDALTGTFTWPTVAGFEHRSTATTTSGASLTTRDRRGFERSGADRHDDPEQIRRAGRRHHLHARRHQRQRLFRAAVADHADDHRHARSPRHDLQPGHRRRAHHHLQRPALQFPGGRRVHAGEIEHRRQFLRHPAAPAALYRFLRRSP